MKDKIRLAVDLWNSEHLDLIMKNCFETKDWRKRWKTESQGKLQLKRRVLEEG